MEKLKSRKFWICVAAALGSLGTDISGLISGNENLALAGGILLVISSSIYAFCEAWVDGKAVEERKYTTFMTNLSQEDEDDGK